MKAVWAVLLGVGILALVLTGVWLWAAHRENMLSAGPGAETAAANVAPAAAVPQRAEFARSDDGQGGTRVYKTLLPTEPGDEWSEPSVSTTKKGDRPYMGDFHPGDPVTLTIPGLPAHQLLRISFDLFLFRSWDGSSPYYGYAKWDLTADDANLVHTTFNNCGFFQGGNDKQAFPDTWPSRWHPAWTLASEHETLGMPQSWGSFTADASSSLHIDLTFPHTGSTVVFQFLSDMQGHDKRKLYGLANVEVSAIAELKHYSPAEMAGLWADLGSSNAEKFWKAQWSLASAGDAATDYIADHLQQNIDMKPEEAKKLLPDLGDQYGYNTEPFEQLAMQGRTLNDVLTEAANSGAPHMPQLVELKDLAARFPATATELRNARAKHVLEIIHSPRALALAEKIPDQPVTPDKPPGQ